MAYLPEPGHGQVRYYVLVLTPSAAASGNRPCVAVLRNRYRTLVPCSPSRRYGATFADPHVQTLCATLAATKLTAQFADDIRSDASAPVAQRSPAPSRPPRSVRVRQVEPRAIIAHVAVTGNLYAGCHPRRMIHSAQKMLGTHDSHATQRYAAMKSPRYATMSSGSQSRSVTAPKIRT